MSNNPHHNPPSHPRMGVAPTQTVAIAMMTMDQLQGRQQGMPGLGVLSGRPGLGKTCALTRLAHPGDINSVYVACRSFETTKSLASLILRELGEPARDHWSVSTMFEKACEVFGAQGRPLVVDEADHIAEKQTIEFLRDLHDTGQVPILLVGEENLKKKLLRRHERFHDRVLVWSKAMPTDESDLAKLISHYTPALQITPEARAQIVLRSRGTARTIVTALHALSEKSKTMGLEEINTDDVAQLEWKA